MLDIHSTIALLTEIANDKSLHGEELRDAIWEAIETIEAA